MKKIKFALILLCLRFASIIAAQEMDSIENAFSIENIHVFKSVHSLDFHAGKLVKHRIAYFDGADLFTDAEEQSFQYNPGGYLTNFRNPINGETLEFRIVYDKGRPAAYYRNGTLLSENIVETPMYGLCLGTSCYSSDNQSRIICLTLTYYFDSTEKKIFLVARPFGESAILQRQDGNAKFYARDGKPIGKIEKAAKGGSTELLISCLVNDGYVPYYRFTYGGPLKMEYCELIVVD
jgi:hypothetical protein